MAKEERTRIGVASVNQEFDPAPILITPRMENRTKVVELEEEDLDDAPEEVKVKEIDVFSLIIKKLLLGQSPAMKLAIEGTACFARVWYSFEDRSYCSEVECGLRKLCETAYHQAIESVEADIEAKDEMDGVPILKKLSESNVDIMEDDFTKLMLQGRKLQIKQREQQKLESACSVVEGFVKEYDKSKPHTRTQYVDKGRPVDLLAKALFQELQVANVNNEWFQELSPFELPDHWDYCGVGSLIQRQESQRRFCASYGHGIRYSKRGSSYHVYFYNGMHLLRFWVNAAGGGWLEMNPHLAEEVERTELSHSCSITETYRRSSREKYRFYPKRIKIKTYHQMLVLVAAVKKTLIKMIVQ